jgi:hypothetical protein
LKKKKFFNKPVIFFSTFPLLRFWEHLHKKNFAALWQKLLEQAELSFAEVFCVKMIQFKYFKYIF